MVFVRPSSKRLFDRRPRMVAGVERGSVGYMASDRLLGISAPSNDIYHLGVIFFFFQAEDGIRDLIVTGVQTCALPISNHPAPLELPHDRHGGAGQVYGGEQVQLDGAVKRVPRLLAERRRRRAARIAEQRSEERRVGKECRSRWSPYH